MKKLLASMLLMTLSTAAAVAADAHAVIVYLDKQTKQPDTMVVWITAASTLNLEFKTAPQSLNRTRMPRNEIKSVYFFEPPLFKEAMELYESRDYKTAREKFAECKEAFEAVKNLPGNYGTLAGFYELESCRKLGDLEALRSLRDAYQFDALVRDNHRHQLEVYDVWDAVRTKGWARLDSLATKLLEEKKWVGEHLAQIHYCHGLALEGLGRDTDALIAFNGAFTADYTASETITKKAALSALRILKENEEVQLAMQLWGTKDEDRNSTGHALLLEANALCTLWKEALGRGQALPAEYSAFLKYQEGSKAAPKPAKEKPEEAPKTT